MVLIALSFQGEVEKYGAYVGIAAFFGLAVLSLLYFSHARELKRLREWAERAPERARELEQRVVAQAAARATRPSLPAQGGIAPPRRLAEMPGPPADAAQAAAAAQATEVAERVEGEEAAANGNKPDAPGAPPAAIGANGAAPPAEQTDAAAGESGGGEEQAAKREGDEQAADEPQAAKGATAESAGEPAASVGQAGEPAASVGQAGDPAASVGQAGEAAASVGQAGEPAASEGRAGEPAASEPQPAAADRAPAEPESQPEPTVAAGEVPVAVPRATPAQRVGVTPRAPAPVPLRQTRPSATPASDRGGGGPRRPGAPGRRPTPAPRERRSAGTIALFVGVAVLILGGGAFAVSQLGGDDTPPAPNRAAPPPTGTADGGGGGTRKPPAETNVAVLNGTTFTGLAGDIADTVTGEGYERGIVETNTRDQTIQDSIVYYAEGERPAARAIARMLSVANVEPIDAETQSVAPDADVVVLAGVDQAP